MKLTGSINVDASTPNGGGPQKVEGTMSNVIKVTAAKPAK